MGSKLSLPVLKFGAKARKRRLSSGGRHGERPGDVPRRGSVSPSGTTPPPGAPGISARWTSSAKAGVGTAPSTASRVWFTLSHGILNEIYYPRVDYACTRDFGLLVTDGRAYFSEEKRHSASTIRPVGDGVPAFVLRNAARDGRYVIEKLVLAD